MKALIYVIAIVAILAGAWFSYGTMNKFTKLQEDRNELDKQNKTRSAFIVKTKKEAVAMEDERDKARAALADAEADLENVQGNIKLSDREASGWKTKVEEQDEQLRKIQQMIASIKGAFKELGDDIQLDQINELVKKLEEDKREADRKLEELQALTEAAGKRVETNNVEIGGLTTRIEKRAKRIAGNSAEGKITAVNHDWGFAVVNVPSEMPVDASSKLVVKRGATLIGKLKINAIEGSRIVTDVDYKSMTPGMVMQPGDAVMLAKPVTN